MVIDIVTVVVPLLSLALGAKLLLLMFGHRDEPRLALVVEGQRETRHHR